MSASQRSTLIAAGIKKAGRSGQTITLTTEFDEILRDMTERYNILAKSDTGTTTADISYLTMPADYSDRRFMTVDTYELTWLDPDDYLKWLRTNTDIASIPNWYTVVKEDGYIYMKNKPSGAWTYYFYYWGIHPASTGDTYTHLLEDKYEEAIIAGLAYKCCERLKDWDGAAKWKADYENILLKKASRMKRMKASVRSNFWGQMG
jgi:hypothetical protein